MRLFPTAAAGLLALGLALPVSAAEDLTSIEDIRPGVSATLQGKVTRIHDDAFRLWDETGSISVYFGRHNPVLVQVGEVLMVSGFVDVGLEGYLRPELHAREIVRADGSRILLNLYALK